MQIWRIILMNVNVFETLEDACHEAAYHIEALINRKHNAVLGLATGRTPLKLYEKIIHLHKQGLSFKDVTTFNLDEYYGLSENHPDSYRRYMAENLFNQVDIKEENTFIPSTTYGSHIRAGSEYDALIIEKGGIDLQILGIGINGHIGFNEPSTAFRLNTHLTALSKETMHVNKNIVQESMPTQAITMGIQSIFKAKSIIILASGKEKGNIIKKALNGLITPEIPLSILALHPNVLLFVDKAAYAVMTSDEDMPPTLPSPIPNKALSIRLNF